MELFPGFDLPLYFLFTILTCVLYYIYVTWPYSQFQKLGISGPPPQLFFGNQRQLFSQGSNYTLKKWAEEYGRVYGIYLCRRPMIVTSDLDIVKAVMVKDFPNFADRFVDNARALSPVVLKGVFSARGGDWKRIRRIMTPTFSAARLKQMEPQINRCSRDLTESLFQKAQKGELVNAKEYFGAYTLDVICSTAFGLQVNSQKDVNDPFLVNIKQVMGAGAARRFQFLGALLAYLPFTSSLVRWIRSSRLTAKPMNFFRDNVQSMIQQRKAGELHNFVDFLQLMINAEDTHSATGSGLTTEEIEAQMLLFFFAGYESSSTTFQFLAYNLAMHPDVQQRIVKEIETVLGEEEPTYENVSKLKYLDQTVHESLRLYSPATMITREALETVTLKGVTIPRGFGVMVSVNEVMKNPEYFPQPDVFDPDRFSEEADMDKVTFLAFGCGPRMCMGMRLALLEIKMALVHILRRMTIVRTPELPETMEFKQGVAIVLTNAKPILLKMVPRHADR